MAELIDNLIQLICVFVCGCYSCFSAVTKRNHKWLLITLFYVSFGMGLAYWVLYLVLFGSSPQVFFVSELSWTASYIFLAIRLVNDIPADERKAKTKTFFWFLPVFSFAMCIFFCIRGSYLENVLMGTALAVCGYCSVKGIFFAKQKNLTGRLWISAAVLFFYAAEYILWISSFFLTDNTFMNPYFLTDTFIMNPALIMIAFAQCREDKICHIT